MTIEARYDSSKRRLLTTARGRISFADLNSHLDEERAADQLGATEVFDAREATTDLTAPQVQQLVSKMRALARTGTLGPTALITHDDVVFGMARMYSLLAHEFDCRFMVYRDIASAEKWLDDGAPPFGGGLTAW